MTTIVQTRVLDEGYVALIEHWGSDERIIEAARMSTQGGFKGWGPFPQFKCVKCDKVVDKDEVYDAEGGHPIVGLEQPKFLQTAIVSTQGHINCWGAVYVHVPKQGDEKLLRYLWEHKHHTPFEMAGAIFEIKAPIMVFREWHRHRTQGYNEMSARYAPLPNENYMPTLERLMLAAGRNKQATSAPGSSELIPETAQKWLEYLESRYQISQDCYEYGLMLGIPKEIARLILPVGRYSKMRATANLRNWLGFLTLRMDVNAQWEIRQYANQVAVELQQLFPRTMTLFEEGRSR